MPNEIISLSYVNRTNLASPRKSDNQVITRCTNYACGTAYGYNYYWRQSGTKKEKVTCVTLEDLEADAAEKNLPAALYVNSKAAFTLDNLEYQHTTVTVKISVPKCRPVVSNRSAQLRGHRVTTTCVIISLCSLLLRISEKNRYQSNLHYRTFTSAAVRKPEFIFSKYELTLA